MFGMRKRLKNLEKEVEYLRNNNRKLRMGVAISLRALGSPAIKNHPSVYGKIITAGNTTYRDWSSIIDDFTLYIGTLGERVNALTKVVTPIIIDTVTNLQDLKDFVAKDPIHSSFMTDYIIEHGIKTDTGHILTIEDHSINTACNTQIDTSDYTLEIEIHNSNMVVDIRLVRKSEEQEE